MNRVNNFIVSALALTFIACGNPNNLKEQVTTLIGSTIVGLEGINKDHKYTIVHYIDSLGCITCKLKPFKWKQYEAIIRKRYNNCAKILFVAHPYAYHDVKKLMEAKEIENIELLIDETNDWREKNSIPYNDYFYTLLLNASANVIVVGEPFYNVQMEALYDSIFSRNSF